MSQKSRSGKPTAQVQAVIDSMLIAGFERHWFSVKAEQIYRGQRKEKLPNGVPIVRSIFEQGKAKVTLRWRVYDEVRGMTPAQMSDLIEPMLETGELDVKLHRFFLKGGFEVDWSRTEITPGTGIKRMVSYSKNRVEEYIVYPDGREETKQLWPKQDPVDGD